MLPLQLKEQDSKLMAGEIVLRPAALLGAALSCLRNTGLYMAARLGTTCKEVMNDHSIERMAQVKPAHHQVAADFHTLSHISMQGCWAQRRLLGSEV